MLSSRDSVDSQGFKLRSIRNQGPICIPLHILNRFAYFFASYLIANTNTFLPKVDEWNVRNYQKKTLFDYKKTWVSMGLMYINIPWNHPSDLMFSVRGVSSLAGSSYVLSAVQWLSRSEGSFVRCILSEPRGLWILGDTWYAAVKLGREVWYSFCTKKCVFSSSPSNPRKKTKKKCVYSCVSKQEDCFVLLWILQHMFREKLCPLWNYRLYRRCTRQIVGTVTETKRIRVREECQDSDRVKYYCVGMKITSLKSKWRCLNEQI
jgi:hypothetical protein